MRWSLLLLLIAIPTIAFAEPKVAVAPLDGDPEGTMGDLVAEAAGERAKVTKQGRTEGAMRSLGVSVLSAKSLKKLRTKLDVDVVIYGTVEKDGGDKRLSLQLSGSGKSKLELEYKSTKQLSKDLAARLPKKIAAAMEGDGGADEDEEDARAKREEEERRNKEEERKREDEARAKREDEDRRRKQEEDDRRKQEDEEKRAERKRKDDDDRRKKRRGDDEGDEDEDDRRASKQKRDKKRHDDREDDEDEDGDRRKKRVADRDDELTDDVDEEERPRQKRKRGKPHVLTQAALWLDAGAAFARRTLTYTSTGMMRPPPVGTAAPAARIEGEVYPAAFSSPQSPAAGIGIVGAYSRTFALGIAVPGTQIVTPISSGHYWIGARYRFVFGQHSVAAGISYWRSHYIADRTQLMNPDQLDMPDVDYSAIAPGIAARIGVTPIVSAFATVDVPLVLKSGPIQDPASYGGAKILAFDLRGGAQVMLASHVALQVGIDFEQVGLTFTGQPGSKASTRMVTKATDRLVGIGATLGITY